MNGYEETNDSEGRGEVSNANTCVTLPSGHFIGLELAPHMPMLWCRILVRRVRPERI